MAYKKQFLILLSAAVLLQGCDKMDTRPKSPAHHDITKKAEEYTQAFNLHDIDKLSSLWIEDALFVNLSTGETIQGSKNISDFFKTQFEKEGAQKITVTLSQVSSSGDHSAQAQGIMETTYTNRPANKEVFLAEYTNKHGQWTIKSLSVNELNAPPSHFDHLKELDWLAGKWVDDDENIDITYVNEWDKNKNFLTQRFVVTVLGEEEISGSQIIGWNPTAKKIQSWIFDSDGGFGQGIWSKDDNHWAAEINFTLPQEGNASSVHVYTKIDDNTYTFASENREINGKLLPNIGPFKIIRQ
jgi:ketosteroid isomerase-like protein